MPVTPKRFPRTPTTMLAGPVASHSPAAVIAEGAALARAKAEAEVLLDALEAQGSPVREVELGDGKTVVVCWRCRARS